MDETPIDNLKKIQELIKPELEFLDKGNFRNKKYNQLQECDIEIFSLINFIQRGKINDCLFYFMKKNLSIKKIDKLFRNKETGQQAESFLKKTFEHLTKEIK